MGNKDKEKEQTSEGASGNSALSPRMPTKPTETSARKGKPGHCLSQAGSRGHSKGNGKSSHTLPGLTQ